MDKIPFNDGKPDKNNNEEDCPLANMAFAMSLMSKPFGMTWPEEKMKKFLKSRGYLIVMRYNKDSNKDYPVAVKPGEDSIDDYGNSNIREVFESEIQDVILDFLANI